MANLRTFWKVFNGILGALAGIVTAITGLYLALRGDPVAVVTVPASISSPATDVEAGSLSPADGSLYQRTPWLGIELLQNGRPVPLRSLESEWSANWDHFEASMSLQPFELRVTRAPDDPAVGITAWYDDSIFQHVQGDVFHIQGTGIAGARNQIPILYLDNEALNYYDEERLNRLEDGRYSIFVSTIGVKELELPSARFPGPIHLVIFRVPEDFNQRTVGRHDFEMFTLNRK